jgi:hypothetical protein
MDFKFVSRGLSSEQQNFLCQHMHKKIWILANQCGNELKHENEDKGPGRWRLVFVFKLFPHLLFKIQNCFYECVEEGCSAADHRP